MKNRSLRFRGAAWAALYVTITGSCGGTSAPQGGSGSAGSEVTDHGPPAAPGTIGQASPLTDKAFLRLKDAPPGLDFRLSDGRAGKPALARSQLAPARPLDDATTASVLSRGRAIAADAKDTAAFALRPATQPPPKTGDTITQSFPPPPSSLPPPTPTDAAKPLAVVRYMPEGKVPIVPELSVTFSQPMVAVTSQSDAAAIQPVKLTPQPAGKWRWLGTRTIIFDPAVRFPQATTYSVEIAAGTKSATGNLLAAAKKFTFETPPPALTMSLPSESEPQRTTAPMLLVFDQRIDAAAVLAKLRVTANGASWPVEQVPANELAKFAASKQPDEQRIGSAIAALAGEQDGRWVALRPAREFPKAALISVTAPAGTPSAEGPNVTKQSQTRVFRTYAPLRITGAECGYERHCPPGTSFVVSFNNPLDTSKFAPEWFTNVSPAISDLKVIASYSYLEVTGSTKARTTYKGLVSKNIVDVFGQTLGDDALRTWTVGDAERTMVGPQGIVVLDPQAPAPTLDYFTTNYDQLRFKLYRVTPADFPAFINHQYDPERHPVPGTKVIDRVVKTTSGRNQLVETALDIAPALTTGRGHAIAIVEPVPNPYGEYTRVSWVQSTRLAVDAYVDNGELIALASELADGKPAAGVELELRPSGLKATSDANGLAKIALPTAAGGPSYLLARRGDDVVFIDDRNGNSGSWSRNRLEPALTWYVTDDRHLYKPGEEVSLKGWLRAIDLNKGGDVSAARSFDKVEYSVRDSNGNEIAKGTFPLTAVGSFAGSFVLPKTPSLGPARVQLRAVTKDPWIGSGDVYEHGFQIEEFRRPEFEVTAEPSQGPFLVGSSGEIALHAKYYAGGGLADAPVGWSITTGPAAFTPPNRDDYVFGTWRPWWGGDPLVIAQPQKSASHAGKTDASGDHTLHVDFLSAKPAVPTTLVAYATVTDVNRQAWAARTTVTVHPSSLYVGLKPKQLFVDPNTAYDIDVIGVDLDGKPAIGAPIEVRAVRLDWTFDKGNYKQVEVDPQTCSVTANAKPVPCTFGTKVGGTYQVTATITDAQGRPNQTTLEFWVSGDKQPQRGLEQERVRIIPNKKEYAPGDTAQLLVQVPFYPAQALVSWRRSGIVKTERVTIDQPTRVVNVPISDGMTPNLFVQVDLAGETARLDDHGDADPKLPKRPAYASGVVNLAIPPKHRSLTVTVSPAAAKLSPGERTSVAVDVADASGKRIADAELAVIAVDESVLALTAFHHSDPLDSFYRQRGADTRDYRLREYVTLAANQRVLRVSRNGRGAEREQRVALAVTAAPSGDATLEDGGGGYGFGTSGLPEAEKVADATRASGPSDKPMAKGKKVGGARMGIPQPIAVRSNFNPLAVFAPAVRTDANGHATVELKLPDNLTRYRIIAIAAAGATQFGKGENAITARLPLMVRPSPPRFLNFGDTFKLSVVVQNQTDQPMTVQLAARATNATLTDGSGREVDVPANDRVEVQFAAAAQLAGTARFQVVGVAGSASDAAELSLPVWTPATTEAFATYGVLDSPGAVMRQPIALPTKVVTQFGSLDVSTSSTTLQALTDALLYLVRYPFECVEQRASRVLAVVALKDVLSAFHAKDLPTAAEMTESVDDDLTQIGRLQNYDGGFAYWQKGRPSEPYASVYVASSLAQASAKGFKVNPQVIAGAKSYLATIENHYPWYYGRDVRQTISAYALATRKVLGDRDIAKAQQLLRSAGGPGGLSMEANGWLLSTFAGVDAAKAERAAIVRHALNRVSETAGAANFTTSYGDGAYLLLASDHRVDAVLLDALTEEDKAAGTTQPTPQADLIPKLVTGLLAHRKAGRWLNTQENTFALLAMDRYFHAYEGTTPDFVARVWLGNDYAGDHTFKGRSTDTLALPIPMTAVAAHDKQALTIQKDGAGRLYYRIGMTYAPASLSLAAADYGFAVSRSYRGVDDPKDVTRDADGTWRIKAGARVEVTLKMANENRRYHVALVDPMPAGFEAMNPALAVTGPIPRDPNEVRDRGVYWWWYGPWYEHQNLRDERVEAFASLLWEGVHTYRYVARATTPGNFVVPPAKAEEMYMPETFGRSASDRVVIQ